MLNIHTVECKSHFCLSETKVLRIIRCNFFIFYNIDLVGLFHLGNSPVFLTIIYMFFVQFLLRVVLTNLNGNQMATKKLLLGMNMASPGREYFYP